MRNKLMFKIIIYTMIASMLLSTLLFTVNLFM
ncbi:stressosome-associated protein Prli42 [Paenibacillus piri]|nr:stressosome-associated protein Prli42 [Paenibacillus piri]